MKQTIECPECDTQMKWEETIIYEDKSQQVLECPICGYTIDELTKVEE